MKNLLIILATLFSLSANAESTTPEFKEVKTNLKPNIPDGKARVIVDLTLQQQAASSPGLAASEPLKASDAVAPNGLPLIAPTQSSGPSAASAATASVPVITKEPTKEGTPVTPPVQANQTNKEINTVATKPAEQTEKLIPGQPAKVYSTFEQAAKDGIDPLNEVKEEVPVLNLKAPEKPASAPAAVVEPKKGWGNNPEEFIKWAKDNPTESLKFLGMIVLFNSILFI